MSIGTRIKDARIQNNLSQFELAQRCNITKSAISNYENGVSSPPVGTLSLIMEALSVDANYLFQDYMSVQESQISALLKQKRADKRLSANEVISLLQSRGIVLSASTLYGYENGVSTPRVITFLTLCDIYGISDVMDSLGLRTTKKSIAEIKSESTVNNHQFNQLFNLFSKLNDSGKKNLLKQAEMLSNDDEFIERTPRDKKPENTA